MISYSLYKTTPAIPEASSMIETFRAIGYSIQTAVADIIDNSISANAKRIWVDFEWKGGHTWLSIKDDGSGMDNEELIRAMRPGSKNPNEIREIKDLGRFGLGLKTASFSQCRKLSVISKKIDYSPVYWTWDLDFVKQTGRWDLIQYLPSEFEHSLDDVTSGTTVIWNDIDRVFKNIKEDDLKSKDIFLKTIKIIEDHLSMVFHRFIETGKIDIFIRNREISAWNPFMQEEPATQNFPDEPLMNGKVNLKGYVLPHHNRLSSQKYNYAKGPKGSWSAHQGFYVYRNNRLLVAGEWLGLFKKELYHDLCRIQIDLPNNFDAEWQIDIKKSIARPPLGIREQIDSYARDIRARAMEVYRHRGKVVKRSLANDLYKPIWIERIKNNKRYYEINKEHPVISDLFKSVSEENKIAVLKALSYLQETIPTALISLRESDKEIYHSGPFEYNKEEIASDIKKAYLALLTKGNTADQAKRTLYFIDPYDHFPEIIETL